MRLRLDLFMVQKPVDDGLIGLLNEMSGTVETIDERMRSGDIYISDWSLFESPHPLIQKQHRELSQICSALLHSRVDIFESWFHIYRSGSAFSRHRHHAPGRDMGAQFSLVYYLDRGDENESGQLRMYDPDILVSPQSGMILLFPGSVEHEVLEYRGDRERVIIACNMEQIRG